MKPRSLLFPALLFLSAGALRAGAAPVRCEAGEARVFEVPPRTQSIAVDGKLDEPAWQEALVFTGFRWKHGNHASAGTEDTEVRVTWDAENLWLGFTCHMRGPAQPVAWAPSHGAFDQWDDRLQVDFDGLASEAAPVQRIDVNAKGFYRALHVGGRLHLTVTDTWSPRFDVAAGSSGDDWTLEMRLPLSELGRSSLAGDLCRLSVARIHSRAGASTLVPSVADAPPSARFASLLFLPLDSSPRSRVLALSRGALAVGGLLTGENRAIFKVENEGGESRRLRFEVASLVAGAVVTNTVTEAAIHAPNRQVELWYPLLGRAGEKVRFSAFEGAGTQALYSATCDVALLNPNYRVSRVKDPIFEPLLDRARPKDPRKNGSIAWWSPIEVPANVNRALKYGWAWSRDEVQEQIKDTGLHFLTYGNWDELRQLPSVSRSCWQPEGELREYGAAARERGWATPVLYAPYYVTGVTSNGIPGAAFNEGFGYMVDPVNARAYLDGTEDFVRRHGKDTWSVFAGDEQLMQNYLHLVDQCKKTGWTTNQFLKAFADDMKARFGGGRHGMEQAVDEKDPNHPFGRASLFQWLQARIRPVNVELRARVKAADPTMPVISDDCMGGMTEDLASFSDYADIATQQLIRPFSLRLQRWTCRVKMLRDLGGVEYVIPLPHEALDGYTDGSCNPDEIVELFSQLMRGGATGVHLYPSSYGGGDLPAPNAGSVAIGYPAAWQLALALAKTMRSLPHLKFPAPDSAIWFSENSTVYAQDDRYPHWAWMDRYDHLVAHVGVEARGWFKFVSDNTVKAGKDKLAAYKVIYVPDLKYSDAEVIAKLTAYAQGGGTVVVLDPDALTFDLLGNSLKAEAEKLLGVVVKGKVEARSVVFEGKPFGNRTLPLLAKEPRSLDPLGPDARVVAKFDTGSPAVIERKLGKGRVLSFAFLPVNEMTLANADWTRFWADFPKQMGCKVGQDIWRFKLPMPEGIAPPTPPMPTGGVCLTGNWGFWFQHHFHVGDGRFNAPLAGVYTVRVAGEEVRGPYGLGEGRLTDRLKAVRASKSVLAAGVRESLDPADWVETFRSPAPVEVVFTFAKPCSPRQLKLFFKGELDGVEAAARDDGQEWEPLGAATEVVRTAEHEVRLLSLDLKAPSAPRKQFRVSLAARPAKIPLTLAEVEVWGVAPGTATSPQ